MRKIVHWIDDRTDFRHLMREALYENIPGGAKWRFVWGSTLIFAFAVQVITGIVLAMCYSPSTQTAWESVYFIQNELALGWLLRGVHHFMASAMVVLLAIHLMQVVLGGAYKAPREFNFWIGLVLMMIVLGLALTGYLLPWDQKGYWATKVATKIGGITPLIGPEIQKFAQGGVEYGHFTLTRFFALHAIALPGLMVLMIVWHMALFRKHGITAESSHKREDNYFWPHQVLKDAVACLVVMMTVVFLSIFLGAPLGAPADPATEFAAARPEWYFLFLFQFLKFFHGQTGEIIGAMVIPGAVMGVIFLMPILGRWKLGHRFNVVFLFGILAGAGMLTYLAWSEDYHAQFVADDEYEDVEKVLAEIRADLKANKKDSKYAGKDEAEQIAAYMGADGGVDAFMRRLAKYKAYTKSRDHIAAVEDAELNAQRAKELAITGIPPTGALSQMRNDPKTRGPRLFRQHCASCHNHTDAEGNGIVADEPSAPNLYGFASREWLTGLLDPDKINTPAYFGNTKHNSDLKPRDRKPHDAEMASFVKEDLSDPSDEDREKLEQAITALSAEAHLIYQQEADEDAEKKGTLKAGREALLEFSFNGNMSCADCHRLFGGDDGDDAPDLTGYGSRQWLIDFISNPGKGRFYGDNNDRMPAFAKHGINRAPTSRHEALFDKAATDNRIPSRRDLELIVDWLRRDWYEPTSESATTR